MILGTLIVCIGPVNFLYCKFRHALDQSIASSVFSCKRNKNVTKAMSSQQLITFPKVKAIPDKVRERLELLGMDFSNFDKNKAHRNSKYGCIVTATSV